MRPRRIIAAPVPEDLDTRIRLAARAKGVTVAAWVREQLLTAVRHPAAEPAPLSKDGERAIARLMHLPQLFTAADVGAFLGLSPHAIRRALRTGELVGDFAQRTVWDPGRRRWLRRRWWRVTSDEVWAYVARRNQYRSGHGLRPYTRRPADAPGPP